MPIWLLVATVVLSLLTLLGLPALVGRVTVSLRRDIADLAEPARASLSRIEFSQAREMAALRGYLITRSPRYVQRYRDAAQQESLALEMLDTLVTAVGGPAVFELDSLRSASRAWHVLNQGVLDGDAGSVPPEALARQELFYDRLIRSADGLEERLRAEASWRRARIEALTRVQRLVSAGLVLLAMTAALIVFGLGRELERRRAAAERERRERTALIESTSEGIYVLDVNGFCTFMNPAAAALLGYAPGELLGKSLHEVIHHSRADGSHYPESECGATRAVVEGIETRNEDEILWRRDGTPLAVNYAASPIVDAGRVVGGVVVFSDATERRRVEHERIELLERERSARRAAELAEAWSRTLAEMGALLARSLDVGDTLDHIAQAVVPGFADACLVQLLDSTGGVLESRARAVRPTTEEAAAELAATGPLNHVLARDDAKVDLKQPVLLRLDADGPPSVATERADLTARLDPASLLILPLTARGGAIGLVAFVRHGGREPYEPGDLGRAGELAARAALAVHNALLHREMQQAVHIRDEVLAVVSHDLRNPLNAIVMSSELLEMRLERGDLDVERARAQLRLMRRAVEQGTRLIGDLLDVGRIQRGQLAVAPEACDVPRLLRDAVELAEPLATEKGVRLERSVAEGLPPALAEQERLQQVFSNLIGNAIRYTPAGGLVRVSARPEPDRVIFEVSDTGCGISEKDLPNLFTAFWQGPQADRGGAGLGLAICRGIVEAHGGRIEAESVPGSGTTVRFWLPATSRPAEHPA